METIIGFVVGYLAGSRDGRDGLERARTSLQAIRNSPEAKRLTADAVGVAGSVLRQASARGLGQTVSGVADLVGRGATAAMNARRESARAA
jgi:hypothetical protein